MPASTPVEIAASSRLSLSDGVCTAQAGGVSISIEKRLNTSTGATPVELQAAALASCVALSVRIVAAQAGLHDALRDIDVRVVATKASTPPSRLDAFTVEVDIRGELDDVQRRFLAEEAEKLCTIGNTLRSGDVRIHSVLAAKAQEPNP